MSQQECVLCRRDGATTPETPAVWVICVSDSPLIYACTAHLESAKKEIKERHGHELSYSVVPLTEEREKALGRAQKLSAEAQQAAAARVKLKKAVKSGSNYGRCSSCGNRVRVARKEWDRAANPKCPNCGGLLEREQQAMSPRELRRHENGLRRD